MVEYNSSGLLPAMVRVAQIGPLSQFDFKNHEFVLLRERAYREVCLAFIFNHYLARLPTLATSHKPRAHIGAHLQKQLPTIALKLASLCVEVFL